MWRSAGIGMLAGGLAGCTPEPVVRGVADIFQFYNNAEIMPAQLNPQWRYLRVQVSGFAPLLVLGYLDAAPDGPVQVWYSATGEVLRLRDGRLVGLSMKPDLPGWSRVAFASLPEWSAVQDKPVRFVRLRDSAPDYRYGIREEMSLRRIPPPADSHLQVLSAASLRWFEESVLQGSTLPPARYALNAEQQVVYGEQCVTNEFCLAWQNWPPAVQGQP